MPEIGIAEPGFGQLQFAQIGAGQEQLRLLGVTGAACQYVHGGLDIDCPVGQPRQTVIDFLSWVLWTVRRADVPGCMAADEGVPCQNSHVGSDLVFCVITRLLSRTR